MTVILGIYHRSTKSWWLRANGEVLTNADREEFDSVWEKVSGSGSYIVKELA